MTSAVPLRIQLAALLSRAVTRSAYTVGRLLRRPYLRMLGLRDAAERDFGRRRYVQAEGKALELLTLAEQFSDDWDYGNAIHHGHLLLGRVALARGDLGRAVSELIAAGHTPGSPQLNSFGPNCQLALELLKAGHPAPVLEFLQLCETFWNPTCSRAAVWARQIRQGSVPNFGPNLSY